MHHRKLHLKTEKLPDSSLTQLQFFSQDKKRLFFTFHLTAEHLEELKLPSSCLTFKYCCQNQVSNISFQRLLQEADSLKSFLHKLKLLNPMDNCLKKFDEILGEIRKEHPMEIKNLLKNPQISNIFTESSIGGILKITETVDNKPIQRRLRKLDTIGKNGFSRMEVYEEINKENGEKYAIRFFNFPNKYESKLFAIQQIAKFVVENSELHLQHENILNYPHYLHRVRDQNKQNSKKPVDICVFSEFCQLNLCKFMELNGKVTSESAIKLMQQIIEGLCYLKGKLKESFPQGIIKPNNIFLKQEIIKIDYLSFSGFFNCNPDSDYLAPELRMDSLKILPPDVNKSDVWSLGALYFFLLHGKPPFSDKELSAKVYIDTLEMDENLEEKSKNILKRMLDSNEVSRITWEDAIKFFKGVDLSANKSTFFRNSIEEHKTDGGRSSREQDNMQVKSSKSVGWIKPGEFDNDDLETKVEALDRLQEFIGYLIQLLDKLGKDLEIEEKFLAILCHFLRKIVLTKFIEALDEELGGSENHWNFVLCKLTMFNEIKPDPILAKFHEELNTPNLPITINEAVDILNPKIPRNKQIFCDLVRSSFGEVIKSLQTKLSEPFLDEKKKKNFEFLQNCLGILLDLPKQLRESSGLVMRFGDFKTLMGFSDAESSPFTSNEY